MPFSPEKPVECVATCRPGLEIVLQEELSRLDVQEIRTGKRAVFFTTDMAGVYRANMAVRTAIQILVPIRTFNARNYEMLYYQSRKTNWHKYFTNTRTLRIDVNGHSPTLRNTQYVVHRVKDGIVDTFRKLSGGIRPSISKENPDIHIVVHLEGAKVTLCLDSSGVPLFKRGYRQQHSGAPMKEDLAAGMLMLAGLPGRSSLIDPMCGSGTLLFEGWMILNNVAPNLNRSFAFQHWLGFNEAIHGREREMLKKQERSSGSCQGSDIDGDAVRLCREILEKHFPQADITLEQIPLQELQTDVPGALMATNPPYGIRKGGDEDLPELYYQVGEAAKRLVPGGRLVLFTTNRQATRKIHMRPDRTSTLFNGALEGVCYEFAIRKEQGS